MQEWIVGLIVACAFLAVARRYMPKALRRALRTGLTRIAQRFGWNRLAARLVAAEQAASCADGCGSCGGCGPAKLSKARGERLPIKLKSVK